MERHRISGVPVVESVDAASDAGQKGLRRGDVVSYAVPPRPDLLGEARAATSA